MRITPLLRGTPTPILKAMTFVALLSSWPVQARAEAAAPSVAMLKLNPEKGVDESTARVLTEATVDALRKTKVFSRVVSARELESVISIEQQKQMMNCTNSSCLAELAGALGVDFVLSGSLAKLGGSYMFNASLVNARTGLAAASVSQRVKGTDEETLLDAVAPVVTRLLLDGGFHPVPDVAANTKTGASSNPAAASTGEQPGSGSPLKKVLLGAGAASFAASALTTVVGVLGLLAVGTVLEDLFGPVAVVKGAPFGARAGLLAGSGVGFGTGVLLTVLLLAVGAALLGVSLTR